MFCIIFYDAVIPNTPSISYDSLIDGDVKQPINCTAENGYPEDGEIWWFKDGTELGRLQPSFVTDDSICKADMTSTYMYLPQKADNGQMITCEVHHRSSSTEFPRGTVTLDVQCKRYHFFRCTFHIVFDNCTPSSYVPIFQH